MRAAVLSFLACLAALPPVTTAEPIGAPALYRRYEVFAAKSGQGLGGLPLYLDLDIRDSFVGGEAYALLPHRFADVTAALRAPPRVCDMTPLHPNVKACTHEAGAQAPVVNLYTGRRHFQTPESSRHHPMALRVLANTPDYLSMQFEPLREPADQGMSPVEIEAVPYGADRALLRVRHGVEMSGWKQALAAGYFATFGYSKIGFSVAGTDAAGKADPIRGMAAAIERNVVRGYFAVESHMLVQSAPAERRDTQALETFFALTERYPEQLREMTREEFLAIKQRERGEQRRLQQVIDQRRAGDPR